MEIKNLAQLTIEMAQICAALKAGAKVELKWTAKKTMTPTQRGSLHIWLEQLAEVLNDGGFDQTIWFTQYANRGLQVPWTKHAVKEAFYKPVLRASYAKNSTEKMDTLEPSEICTIVGRSLSERLGITPPPWPTRYDPQP